MYAEACTIDCMPHMLKPDFMGLHWKIQFLGRGFKKKQYIRRNCLKREKNTWRYHLYQDMIWRCMVAEIWCTMDWLTDGRTDRGKKWHIEVGVPPKNTTERMFSFKYTKNELHHKYFPRFYIDSYLCFTICRNFNNTYFTELLATALT